MTRLRLSAHPLNVEALRGFVVDPTERKCNMCTLNSMEDEYHFLTECPKYNDNRTELFVECLNDNPNTRLMANKEKTIWLLTNEEESINKALGRFIHECLKIRKMSTTHLL